MTHGQAMERAGLQRRPSVLDDREYARSRMELRSPSSPPPVVAPAEDRPFGLMALPWTVNAALLGKPLSEREEELLGLIRDGATNKQIAFALSIGEQTVKNHVSSILAKLGAPDRTAAVVAALRLDLIPINSPLTSSVDTITLLCDLIADRQAEVVKLTRRLSRLLAGVRESMKEPASPERVRVCSRRGCAERSAEYSGRGRRPVKCELHINRPSA